MCVFTSRSVTHPPSPSPPVTCQVRCQPPAERQQVLSHLESQLADFLSDSKDSALFTPAERRELEEDVQRAQQHCQDLLLHMETGETRRSERGPKVSFCVCSHLTFERLAPFRPSS